MNLKLINELSAEEARETFLKCCGCERWARELAEGRPYASEEEIYSLSERSFETLTRDEWLEAFGAHPKIGDMESLKKKYSATKEWAEHEQSRVHGTPPQVLQDLAAGNSEYENKFGYIFIVCATGKTAEEMLSILTQRIRNNSKEELGIAAAEQKKITNIRLGKL